MFLSPLEGCGAYVMQSRGCGADARVLRGAARSCATAPFLRTRQLVHKSITQWQLMSVFVSLVLTRVQLERLPLRSRPLLWFSALQQQARALLRAQQRHVTRT